MKKLLFVDDIRSVPIGFQSNYIADIARSYSEAIQLLNLNEYHIISLDHDLGEEKTGYDICKYLIETNNPNLSCATFCLHTSNPVGMQNMKQLLERYTDSNVYQLYL